MIRIGSQLLQLLAFKLVILYHEKSLLKLYQAAFTSYKDPYKFALQLSIGRLHQAGQTITPGQYRSWVQGPDNEKHGSVQFTMYCADYTCSKQSGAVAERSLGDRTLK